MRNLPPTDGDTAAQVLAELAAGPLVHEDVYIRVAVSHWRAGQDAAGVLKAIIIAYAESRRSLTEQLTKALANAPAPLIVATYPDSGENLKYNVVPLSETWSAPAADIKSNLRKLIDDAKKSVGYEPLDQRPQLVGDYISESNMRELRRVAADPTHKEHEQCRAFLATFDCGDGIDYSKPVTEDTMVMSDEVLPWTTNAVVASAQAKALYKSMEMTEADKMIASMGIPRELLEASAAGSGYSGRAIPLAAFQARFGRYGGDLVTGAAKKARIYDARLNSPLPGAEPFPANGAEPFPFLPCRVVDANGHKPTNIAVARCNLDTGEVEGHVLVDGRYVIGPNREVAWTKQVWPAPLRLEKCEPVVLDVDYNAAPPARGRSAIADAYPTWAKAQAVINGEHMKPTAADKAIVDLCQPAAEDAPPVFGWSATQSNYIVKDGLLTVLDEAPPLPAEPAVDADGCDIPFTPLARSGT